MCAMNVSAATTTYSYYLSIFFRVLTTTLTLWLFIFSRVARWRRKTLIFSKFSFNVRGQIVLQDILLVRVYTHVFFFPFCRDIFETLTLFVQKNIVFAPQKAGARFFKKALHHCSNNFPKYFFEKFVFYFRAARQSKPSLFLDNQFKTSPNKSWFFSQTNNKSTKIYEAAFKKWSQC
jgi:hypothetical protein